MNNDLISREALLREARRLIDCDEEDGTVIYTYINSVEVAAVKLAPAVDAVPVVRCKNCVHSTLIKHFEERGTSPWCYFNSNSRICRCRNLIEDEPILVEDDFFCAYGEVEKEPVAPAPSENVNDSFAQHGKWLEDIVTDYKANPQYSYKRGYKCSLCGRLEHTNKEPYCHCGARMILEEE